MAGKPKPMSQIKQLLRLHQQGRKIKTIARELGISKNTVKVYLQRVQQQNWPITSPMALEDPVLEAKFHAGNPAYKDTRLMMRLLKRCTGTTRPGCRKNLTVGKNASLRMKSPCWAHYPGTASRSSLTGNIKYGKTTT